MGRGLWFGSPVRVSKGIGMRTLKFSDQGGFTLVELLWACGVLSLLYGISISMYEVYKDKAETARARVTMHNTRTALEAGRQYLSPDEAIAGASGQHGEPLAGDLDRALPGLAVSDGVMINLNLIPCGPGTDVDHMEMISVYACNVDSYVWYVRTCGGFEIVRNYPGSAPGVC